MLEAIIKQVEEAGLCWAIEGGPGVSYGAVVQTGKSYVGDSLAGPSAEIGDSPADALAKALAAFKTS